MDKDINQLDDELIMKLSDFFQAFSDSTRMKILVSLQISEANVTELTKKLNMTKSAISHQLRLLKAYKLVKARKSGKEVYYSLDDEHVSMLIKVGIMHIEEEK